jgi:DNA-binding PadR family transcriptional regulator
VLDALRDGPKHGYEIIKWLQERSSGQYVPSPGTVYPTLQFLEDLGQVRADQEAERRVYHLTEAGQTEWQARAEEIAAFWARLQGPEASAAGQAEVGFLREELENLAQTVEIGIRTALERSDTDALRGIRQTIETCRNEIRRQIAGQGGSETSNS